MSTPALQFRGVNKRFTYDILKKPFQALTDLSLAVPQGSVFGFVGHNGAGKTTAIKIALSLIRPTSGEIDIMGERHDRPAARRHVGFLPERPYFYDYLTARESLAFHGRLAGVPAGVLGARIDELIERVGLSGRADERLRGFSKGMLQRFGMAQALIGDPPLLLLDEPMSGLDPLGRRAVRNLIAELGRAGKTIFFSSHILSDVEELCDHVALVVRGRLRAEGPLAALLSADGRREVVLRTDAPAPAGRLTAAGALESSAGRFTLTLAPGAAGDALIRDAVAAGAVVERVTPVQRRLEDVFEREYREAGLSPHLAD